MKMSLQANITGVDNKRLQEKNYRQRKEEKNRTASTEQKQTRDFTNSK